MRPMLSMAYSHAQPQPHYHFQKRKSVGDEEWRGTGGPGNGLGATNEVSDRKVNNNVNILS
jgi:hypothetical protein